MRKAVTGGRRKCKETSPFIHLAKYYYYDEIKHEERERKEGSLCFGRKT
jgi:hypothetical protein